MPSDRLPSLDRLLVFDAAARRLSFTKAATELFLTQSAVSRQVATLEAEIGVPLFRRRHRALDLTDDGRRLAGSVAATLATLRDTVAQIRAPHGREVLTITTTPGLASLWLIPRLAGFTSAHPGVDVRIDASHELRALGSEGVDLAIRYGRAGALEGAPLFNETVLPVCAPALLKRQPLRAPAELARHTLLQTGNLVGSGMPAEWSSWLAAAGVAALQPQALLTFSTYDAAVAAAVAGQGVVLGRRPLIDGLLRSKALVAPFKAQRGSSGSAATRGYAVLMSAAAARRPAARALHDWLLEQAREQQR
jgi:LysR family transcriptional regulator, glycine cleavage system transcriptional activator